MRFNPYIVVLTFIGLMAVQSQAMPKDSQNCHRFLREEKADFRPFRIAQLKRTLAQMPSRNVLLTEVSAEKALLSWFARTAGFSPKKSRVEVVLRSREATIMEIALYDPEQVASDWLTGSPTIARYGYHLELHRLAKMVDQNFQRAIGEKDLARLSDLVLEFVRAFLIVDGYWQFVDSLETQKFIAGELERYRLFLTEKIAELSVEASNQNLSDPVIMELSKLAEEINLTPESRAMIATKTFKQASRSLAADLSQVVLERMDRQRDLILRARSARTRRAEFRIVPEPDHSPRNESQ